MREHQRPDARQSLKYDCHALTEYLVAERHVSTLTPAQEPAFRPGMSLEEKMRMVSVSPIYPCFTGMPPLTLIASCTRPDIAGRYLRQALSYMPRDDLAPLYERSPQLDPDSLMLFPSTLGRAQGALSWPLLTARGSQINPGGNPDPNRAGLSRGDIERVMTLYPQRRAAP